MSRNTLLRVALFGVSALVLVLALVFSSGTEESLGALDPELEDRDAFGRYALESLRAADLPGELEYDPERFLIQSTHPDGGVGLTLFLSNFHNEYLAAPPERRGEVLARLQKAGEVPEGAETYAQARARLMPVVRARDTFEAFSQLPVEKVPVSWRPLGEVLAVALVQDSADAMRYVSAEDLARWGISFEQAHAEALTNLRRLASVPLRPLVPGACALVTDDSYGASRLLLEDVVRGCEVRGEPVVMVPNRDTLLITGSEDGAGLSEVAELAMAGLKVPRPVDGHALRLTAEGWKPFLPERGAASWSTLHGLAFASRVRAYQEQTERLRKEHEPEASRLFVAGFLPEQDARERFYGKAIWSNRGETLLPRVELVIFVDESLGPDAPPVASVRWDLVVRDAGTLLMPEPGLYPERYRALGFPSKEQLQRWKAEPTAMDVP